MIKKLICKIFGHDIKPLIVVQKGGSASGDVTFISKDMKIQNKKFVGGLSVCRRCGREFVDQQQVLDELTNQAQEMGFYETKIKDQTPMYRLED